MSLVDSFKWAYNTKTSKFHAFLRIVLGASLLFAGVSHLTFNRLEFVAQVPNWVPVSTDLVIILSGIVEIVLGLSFIVLYRWKTLVGLATAIFFVLIFPGNISQYTNQVDAFGLDTDRARLIRLFFQPVLVLWALWSTGFFRAIRNKEKK